MNLTARIDDRSLQKVFRNLKRYQKGVQDQVKKELLYTAVDIERDAKLSAAVDTGRLRSSIGRKSFKSGLTQRIGTNVKYAPFVEFGTVRQRAQPFLYPALEKNKNKLKTTLIDVIRGKKKRWF